MPKKETLEVLQLNVQAVITVTDSKGKVAHLLKQEASVMEANFDITLEQLAKEILKDVRKAQAEQAAAATNAAKVLPGKPTGKTKLI